MKAKFISAFVLLALLCAGCASTPPTAVKLAQEKGHDSIVVARENLEKFGEAALADLEAALLEQVDREFEARLAALADADGRAALVDVKKEMALATAARQRERETVRGHFATLKSVLKDLDNALALNLVLGEYLNRERVSAQ
ncbi:MAG: hypothetical protein DRP79_05110, partial [Planctomycetota bacterium]